MRTLGLTTTLASRLTKRSMPPNWATAARTLASGIRRGPRPDLGTLGRSWSADPASEGGRGDRAPLVERPWSLRAAVLAVFGGGAAPTSVSSTGRPWDSDQRSRRSQPDDGGAEGCDVSQRPVDMRKVLRSIWRMMGAILPWFGRLYRGDNRETMAP